MQDRSANVLMEKDGHRTEVANNESVQIMEAQGWKLVEPEAPKAPADMTAKELKAELEAYRVDAPSGADKAKLVELVTAAREKAAGRA